MRTGRTERGFSLLEILVAFSILALSLGVLMQIFSASLRNADITRDQAQAVVLAQSLLASAGVETTLAAGESSGAVADKFRWRLQTRRFVETAGAGSTTGIQTALPLDLWEVTARVAWGAPERELALTTLRVQPTAKP